MGGGDASGERFAISLLAALCPWRTAGISGAEEAAAAHREFLRCAAGLARDQWTQFHPLPMVVGVLLLAASLASLVLDW